MRDGLRSEEAPPSPKVQLWLATVPSGSLLVLVKLQLSPEQLALKLATGGWLVGGGGGGGGGVATMRSSTGTRTDAVLGSDGTTTMVSR